MDSLSCFAYLPSVAGILGAYIGNAYSSMLASVQWANCVHSKFESLGQAWRCETGGLMDNLRVLGLKKLASSFNAPSFEGDDGFQGFQTGASACWLLSSLEARFPPPHHQWTSCINLQMLMSVKPKFIGILSKMLKGFTDGLLAAQLRGARLPPPLHQ